MPVFSHRSKSKLESCHDDLKTVCNFVIQFYDLSILEGYRDKDRQNRLYNAGKTKVKWPESDHNLSPSKAVDVAPYPIDWDETEEFTLLAGYMLMAAEFLYSLGIISHRLQWGGDWDMDQDLSDNRFNDLGHFALVKT